MKYLTHLMTLSFILLMGCFTATLFIITYSATDAVANAETKSTVKKDAPWEEIDDDDGITVWTREADPSGLREVKAKMILNLNSRRVWDTLNDTAHYTDFMPYVEIAKIVGEHENGFYEYQLINPPLVSRRDYTVKLDLTIDHKNGNYKRSWNIAKDKGPKPREDAVRVTINSGTWLIERMTKNQTQLTYSLLIHPGGSLPTWIANRANKQSVPDLMQAIRSRSKNPTWKQ